MLKSLHVQNLTLFSDVTFQFGKNLNVIVGENGTGKSHLLKAAYCPIAVSAQGGIERAKSGDSSDVPTKKFWETELCNKLTNVFKPDSLGRLASRRRGQSKCCCEYQFDSPSLNLAFSFSTGSSKNVSIDKLPESWSEKHPVFLPTHELLSIAPGFVALYNTMSTSFQEIWRDTCLLLDAPLFRGPREKPIKELLEPIEKAMGGKVESDKVGRFYLVRDTGKIEMHLVAEGLRKLAMLARLIATGSLLEKGYLFWDEPESNLNPRTLKVVAEVITQIAGQGVQVFIATHSLFLLRHLHILQRQKENEALDVRYFGLHLTEGGMAEVQQGATLDDIGDITALDEELKQADLYLDTEMGLSPYSQSTEE